MSPDRSSLPLHHPRVRSCSSARGWRAALLGLLSAAALAVSPARASADDPNAIKADMLCSMAKFVQWPDAVLVANKGQMVVAILGEDDLAASIANVLSTRSINGKPIFVRFVRRVQDVRGCQIVYIAASESARIDEIVAALRGSPTLTLADSEGFATRGGMMNFTGVPPRVRFEVSLARAEQSGLKISSRLLATARVVDANPVGAR